MQIEEMRRCIDSTPRGRGSLASGCVLSPSALYLLWSSSHRFLQKGKISTRKRVVGFKLNSLAKGEALELAKGGGGICKTIMKQRKVRKGGEQRCFAVLGS